MRGSASRRSTRSRFRPRIGRCSRVTADHAFDTLPGHDDSAGHRAAARRRRAAAEGASVRRSGLARRPSRGRHRAPLPALRAARPPRTPSARDTNDRVRESRRSGPDGGPQRARQHERRAGARIGGVSPSSVAASESGGTAVLRNRSFLLLWLSQLATQIGANMVLYGLTVVVFDATDASTAVSGLFLTFLVPSVLFSALAGVYVDRLDRRTVLVGTNVLRAAILIAIFAVGNDIPIVLLLNIAFATVTAFFAPAEASMIPALVPRAQLVSANGLFTVTLNGAFALGYAFLGPVIVKLAGPEPVILAVAVLFGVGAVFCATLPSHPPAAREPHGARTAVSEAGQAVGGPFARPRAGVACT